MLQPLWDWLFFWQKVPDRLALETDRFRLLNPQVIREAALDLLKYPPPRPRLWWSDQVIHSSRTGGLNRSVITYSRHNANCIVAARCRIESDLWWRVPCITIPEALWISTSEDTASKTIKTIHFSSVEQNMCHFA